MKSIRPRVESMPVSTIQIMNRLLLGEALWPRPCGTAVASSWSLTSNSCYPIAGNRI